MSGFLPTVAYFVVQISDFQNFFQISEHHILDCHLYADDTTIFTDNKSLSNINLKLQSDLTNVWTWSESNGLSVNPKKNRCSLCYTMLKNLCLLKYILNLNYGDTEIQCQHNVKLLGVDLMTHYHSQTVDNVCSRLYLLNWERVAT